MRIGKLLPVFYLSSKIKLSDFRQTKLINLPAEQLYHTRYEQSKKLAKKTKSFLILNNKLLSGLLSLRYVEAHSKFNLILNFLIRNRNLSLNKFKDKQSALFREESYSLRWFECKMIILDVAKIRCLTVPLAN